MRIVPDDDALKAAHILAIDDEPANLSLVERAFRREGFTRIDTHLDPRSALDAFVAGPPDLVLLDLMMPGVDGYELLDGFRRLTPPDDWLPILVLTADSSVGARLRALSLGARDVLLKPYDVGEMLLRSWVLLDTRRAFKRLGERDTNAEAGERPARRPGE